MFRAPPDRFLKDEGFDLIQAESAKVAIPPASKRRPMAGATDIPLSQMGGG